MRWFWQKNKSKATYSVGVDDTSRVRVYDFDTKLTHLIPAAELAPGMVNVRINGVEGQVWVEASRLKQNTFQHGPFTETVRDSFREIKAALDEVYPMSLEAWEDGFRRDRNPEPEIAHWLHVARVYARLVAPEAGLGSTMARRNAIFKLIIGCGVAPREQVLLVAERGELTREEAERVVAAFYDGDQIAFRPAPIS